MLDIKFIRDNPQAVISELGRKGVPYAEASRLVNDLVELEVKNRRYIQMAQENQTRRNELSASIPKLSAEDRAAAIEEVRNLKHLFETIDRIGKDTAEKMDRAMLWFPNLLAVGVPTGTDESHNIEIRKVGEPREFTFEPKDHVVLGERINGMDFKAASRMSGSRFVVTKGEVARLERALGQFMLDLHTRDGFLEVNPPLLVHQEAMVATGQLPKFEEDLFKAGEHYLIPTAEVSLTNLVRDTILSADELPMRLVAMTPCFRAEAGSAGRDTRGIIRQHQFYKVELVSITGEDPKNEHLLLLAQAEKVLKALELPYRVVQLCGGDTGFSAAMTYDIEVWIPSQQAYREISSVSDFGTFQARRLDARYRPEPGASTKFVNTFNGSGVAVGRALVAVMENYQNEDGSITIPEALYDYMGYPLGHPVFARGLPRIGK